MSDDNSMSTRNTVSRVNTSAMEKANRAWQLRVAGVSWDGIAKAVGFADKSAAYRAVNNFFGGVPQPDRGMLREVARQRGEHLWRRAFQAVEETKGSPAAIRAALAVLERHARLDGLDEPNRVEVNMPDGEDFQRLVAAAAAGMGLEIPVNADIFSDEFMYEDAEVVDDELGSPS
ncbi:hypothetical protein G3H63_10855 [Microbacterium resistens]|uniref:hypothetical protein n=1 Tax=Microbacterium resistens TaxID=156977 RepID=UPI001C595C83|nr:hypothetical protein [Microbacterium resistens]MBW1639565.1 hypothetical protein [Microbacterium resistens]